MELIPKSNNSDASMTPKDPYKNKINFIGGTSWQSSGSRLEWKFKVEKSGYYYINMRYKQSDLVNGESWRWLKIDGKTPFAEAKEIREKCPDILIETFMHGAMCMSYSGRCLISNYLADRSANQGKCAHCCRWHYKLHLRLKDGSIKELTIDENNKDSFEFLLEEEFRPGEYFEVVEDEHVVTDLTPQRDKSFTLDVSSQTLQMLAEAVAKKISDDITNSDMATRLIEAGGYKRDNEILAKQVKV